MDVRTYRAATMHDALMRVRRELGPDAAVLHTREVRRRRLFGLLGGAAEIEVTCTAAGEAPFRPATYGVDDTRLLRPGHPRASEVVEIVSMIGIYRDIAEPGETLRAEGVLEEACSPSRGKWVRLVVGSGRPGEYIDWG